jgi:penicillin amidase
VWSALAVAVALAVLAAGGAAARVRQAKDILPPGQSGFVSLAGLASGTGSPHLQDQTPLFLRHDFKPMLFGQPSESTEAPRAGVSIARDSFGVPRITGKTTDDVWFGAGFAVAQDRLFQLELFRRATTGHLAEILGKSYVDMDTQVRRDFYTRPELDVQLAALSPALRRRFQSMTDGINAWIAETRTDPSKLPGEFAAVGDNPADWAVEDSAAIGVYLARTVPSDDGVELDNVRALRAFGAKLFDRLVPIRQKAQTVTIPRSSGLFPSQPGRTRKQERAAYIRSQAFALSLPLPETTVGGGGGGASASARGLPLIGRLGQHGGSNMWAIRGKGHSATFWNGPQLGFQIPELFVEMELHGPGIDIRGTTAPGVPVIGIGHNAHVAWGLTSGLTDDDDLFAEQLAGPESYFFKGQRVDMSCRDETIDYRSPPSDFLGVPSGPPESGSKTVRLCRTLHGPVQNRGGDVAYARRYAIWKHEIGTLSGLADVNAARSVKEVDRAAAKLTWNENLMAADDQGHIGYWHPGLLALKPRGFDERFPYPGTGEAEWRGFLTPKQRPHAIDPKQGYLFNWNNMPSVGWTQGDAPARERLLGPFHRAAVIGLQVRKAIKAGGGFARTAGVDAFTRTHAQQRVLMGKQLAKLRKGASGQAATVLDTILRWDGSFDRKDSKGNVDPGVATWQTFTDEAKKLAFARYHGAGVDSVLDSRGGSHLFESTVGEVYALRKLSKRSIRTAATTAFGVLQARFGSANPATWREPRRMYHPGSQGAASMPDIPFFDSGTFEQVLELGP